jgi:hypothetical protein
MALDSTKLEAAFALSDDEAETIETFVTAWGDYFYDASVAGVPCAGGSIDSALDSMATALEGMSASGAFPGLLQTAMASFWGFLSSNAVTIWPMPPNVAGPVTPPPGVATLAASMAAVLTANSALTDPEDISEAYENLASFLHSNAGLGGLCTVTTPVPVSTPTPIL